MIPLFKTHYSLGGRSLLTLDPKGKSSEDGSDSIFDILEENGEKELWLVEDEMIGLFKAVRLCDEYGIALRFGYRFSACGDFDNPDSYHKLVFFARNDEGIKELNRFVSYISEKKAVLDNELQNFASNNLVLMVPFYDSFIHKNNLSRGNCVIDIAPLKPSFFVEDNGLPFDAVLKDKVETFAATLGSPVLKAKTILYKHNCDAESLQVYKMICNRSFSSKRQGIDNPNLEYFGSDEFSYESYLKNK